MPDAGIKVQEHLRQTSFLLWAAMFASQKCHKRAVIHDASISSHKKTNIVERVQKLPVFPVLS
jgi:uncharacterized protein YydD (DUF2326 family)